MKLLFADKYPEEQLERLRAAGHDCELAPDLTTDDLAPALKGVDGLVVRSTKVTKKVIDAGDSLQLIIRAGSGTNTIAVSAATAKKVQVSNAPGLNAIAVAELAMGLIISIDRNIPDNVAELREGRWDKKRFSEATGIYGRKLAIVGLGNVGLELAERAKAFGMGVFGEAKNRDFGAAARIVAADIELLPDLSTLLQHCDVVSLHVPYDGEAVVDADFLSHLQPGAILINTSRGELVDEAALIAAMDDKGIRAGLDVFAKEPAEGSADFSSDLAQHPNVYGTHHIGASTTQAQNAVADEVVAIIEDFALGLPRNQVGGK